MKKPLAALVAFAVLALVIVVTLQLRAADGPADHVVAIDAVSAAERSDSAAVAPGLPVRTVPRSRRATPDRAPTAPPRRFGFRTDLGDLPPESQANRVAAWKRLESFAKEAELDERTWQRFLGDIADMVDLYQPGIEDRELSIAEKENLSDQLGIELEDRLAQYLSPRQLKVFHRRFLGWEVVALATGGRLLQAIDDDPGPQR